MTERGRRVQNKPDAEIETTWDAANQRRADPNNGEYFKPVKGDKRAISFSAKASR